MVTSQGASGVSKGVNSVHLAFAVLNEVARVGDIGVTELARNLEMPKSSAQRYVSTLHDAGWLIPVAASSSAPTRWRIGPEPIGLGLRAVDRLSVQEILRPALGELSRSTAETVLLSLPEDRGVLVVERIEGAHALRIVPPLGEYMPYTGSAAGLALAPHLKPARWRVIQEVEAEAGFPPVRAEDLTLAQQQGYAINNERWTEGVSAVGAAVLDKYGTPRGAISVASPTSRMSVRRAHEIGAQIVSKIESVGLLLR